MPISENDVSYEGAFSLSQYELFTDVIPEKLNLGTIQDAAQAAEKANDLWKQVFGKEFKGKILVAYDAENQCWLIEGTFSLLTPFYFPNAIIASDGVVLSVWREQF